MIKWSEILEQNRENIIKELEKSFRDAVDCRYMQHIIEIYQDGTIRSWSCVAGSHSFSSDSWNEKSIEVGRFCFQNMDIETTEEDFRRHMTEEMQENVEWHAEEEGLSFLNYIYNSEKYRELIQEAEQEWIDWYKDEYAYSSALDTLDNKIYLESEYEEYKIRYGEE